MDKTRRILITSCKGGVGKSTVAANLAYALACAGKRVLVIDFDLGNRTLDLIFGCESGIIFDFSDVMNGRAKLSDAVIMPREKCGGLLFLPAPSEYAGDADAERLGKLLTAAETEYSPDYIFLDTSGGADISVKLAAAVCSEAVIVTTQHPTAVRAAEKSAVMLDFLGVTKQFLIVNGFELIASASKERASVIDIIDRTRVRILGIVPLERGLSVMQERGKLAAESGKSRNSAVAFANIANRLCGLHVPLMRGFLRTKRSLLLK